MWFGYIVVAIRNGWNQQSGILQNLMELRGIDPRTSHMLSERSTIWATAPRAQLKFAKKPISSYTRMLC